MPARLQWMSEFHGGPNFRGLKGALVRTHGRRDCHGLGVPMPS